MDEMNTQTLRGKEDEMKKKLEEQKIKGVCCTKSQ